MSSGRGGGPDLIVLLVCTSGMAVDVGRQRVWGWSVGRVWLQTHNLLYQNISTIIAYNFDPPTSFEQKGGGNMPSSASFQKQPK